MFGPQLESGGNLYDILICSLMLSLTLLKSVSVIFISVVR